DRPEGRPREEAVRVSAGDERRQGRPQGGRGDDRGAGGGPGEAADGVVADGARHEAGPDARAARQGAGAARGAAGKEAGAPPAGPAGSRRRRGVRRAGPAWRRSAPGAAGDAAESVVSEGKNAQSPRKRSSFHGSPCMWYPFSSQKPARSSATSSKPLTHL